MRLICITFLCLTLYPINYSCSTKEVATEDEERNIYFLTVTSGEGGVVTPDASGSYYEGTTITLTATPEEGYVFDRWLGSDFDNNGCNFARFCRTAVTMNSDRDIQAYFKKE